MLGSLRALLEAEQPRLLPAERALGVLGAVCDTLFPVHAAGRAHGGFSPSTIQVGGDTAQLGDGEPEAAYVAPEVRAGGAPSPAADAYSYAVLAHELLAGGLPEFGPDGTPLSIAQARTGFPAFAGEAIARALQADPAARPLPKVLFTLLRVVPEDRWPAASQPDPEPAPEPVAVEPVAVEPVAAEPVAVEPAPAAVEGREPAPEVPEHHEWQAAVAPAHDVPDIDWQAGPDPTRPSDEVPSIDWSHDEAGEDTVGPEIAEPAATEAVHVDEHPVEADEVDEVDEALTGTREQPAVQVDDATFLHDFMDSLRAPREVPAIEPLEQGIPQEQLEHRPGRRVRRKRRERSPERTQKVVLVLILLVLIAVGAAWALSHKDAPKYDPKLQGASLVLSQPAPART